MCILSIYTFVKRFFSSEFVIMILVFCPYLMGFPKKFGCGVGGWGELHPSFFWIFGKKLTLQCPLVDNSGGLLNSYSCRCSIVSIYYTILGFQILKAKLNLPPYLTNEARGLLKKVS